VNAATRKAQDILSYLLCGMEGNVRRWVISILISTSDGPKMRGELLNSLRHNWRLIGSRRPSKQYQFSDREFDQSRGKYYQYPARLLTPSGPVPLVSQRSGKYIGNLDVLLRNVGLTYSNQTERQTAKVHLLRNVDFR